VKLFRKNIFLNQNLKENKSLLTLSFRPKRIFIFPHLLSPRRGGSPNEPSPQLYKKYHIYNLGKCKSTPSTQSLKWLIQLL